MKLEQLLQEMVDAKASDVFIIAGLPLAYSVSGRQVRLDSAPFKPADTEAFVGAIYEASGRNMDTFMQNGNHDDDFSFALPGIGRFRANVFRQRGSYGAVIRVIPFGLPDPAEFHIPDEVLRLAKFQKGLVLVTGPAGAGKSTTLACIIDRLNHERSGHIITMEDPIEYVHKHGTCIVTQREVPTDVATYSEALRSAMRESPDVILLGEMLHGLVGVHGRAARGDDGLRRVQLAQNLVLHLDETLGTARVDELLQRLVAAVLDDEVGVDEVVVQDLRQHDAEGRFAGAGHADEHDVVFFCHEVPPLLHTLGAIVSWQLDRHRFQLIGCNVLAFQGGTSR